MQDKNEEAIFDAAMELDNPAERARFVVQACGGDPKLLADVEALLRSHDSRSLLDAPVLDSDAIEDQNPVTEGPGTVIGRYKLLERIGEGGMAVVYMAEQEQPIRRKVALKIIKLGMDTRQVIARFEAERQALALMDHPSIAKVLDAGATDTGRPYFVMELVQGVSITEYCDKNSLSTKDRLALFLQVCHAVQHAHQKGIIHRDIKPSNVMVTHHDGKPVPKVIDFGIAKATNQRLTEKTLFTRYAHIIGTPAYMSPEQAELSDLDIDTRSDIYSLGVLLYELLTGTTPFSEEELRKAGYIEMQRIIREQEPVKPSTRIRTALRGASVPARRGTGILPVVFMGWKPMPHKTSCEDARPTKTEGVRGTPYQQVRGDLDWIVMKSLEKDRTRRYEAVNGLAEDIRRHLEHEPVLARGPSTGYRVRKSLRKHRSEVLAVLAMAIIAGAVLVILSMWNRDRLQLAEAEGFKHRNILSQAREQYAKADREAALATVQPILQSRHVGPESQLLHASILVDNRRSDEAVAVLGNLLNERPEIAGAAHSLLARILWENESPSAERLKEIQEHRRQAEALLPETAEAYFLRAMTGVTVKEQLAALNKALALDPDHYESLRLRAFTHYASRKYERMRDDALGMMYLRRGDPLGYSLRAIALRELGKYEEAIAEYDQAMARTPQETSESLDLATQRCETLLRMGRYEPLIAAAQEMLKLWPDKPVFQYHLFCAWTALGDVNEAQDVFQKIVHSSPTARNEFWFWATKYVFDTLEAGRSWHPPDHTPAGAAFLPLVEAEETHRGLSAKAHRVALNGFSADWSPDGKKLAFSLGVHGYSGVALYDPATKETELLIVPGKDPRWSPDGKYIAFVRDCQALRLEELTATERKDQDRPWNDEEVWLMKSDGNEPRRLAQGGSPSWSRDGAQVYYHSRRENMLCAIFVAASNVEPKRIMACSSAFPSVSPDEQQVAYLEYKSLTVKDLASQAVVAQWRVPFDTWGGPAWSPTGQEVCVGAGSNVGDRTGLWIYPLDSEEPVKVLTSQIMVASWAPDGTKLVFALRPPYFELWTADLDSALSTVKALGPGQTLAEHWQDMLRLYTRRMEADPQDASVYCDRARYYDYLHDRAQTNADMRRWSAVMSGRSPSDSGFDTLRGTRHVLDLPLDCELVFSAERPVHKIPVLSVAFGQKGRSNMKTFRIPLLSLSLVGLGLFSGLRTPPAHADFTFGEPVSLKRTIPAVDGAYDQDIASCTLDGLEMYLHEAPGRAGGQGGWDLWVLKRDSIDADWGLLENLGPAVNGPSFDANPAISPDGLTLYFTSSRSGGYGGNDLYMTTRATRNAPWGQAVNMGPKVNTPKDDGCPRVTSDNLELYFNSNRPGGYGNGDIYVCRRATISDPWGDPVNLGPVVNSAYHESVPDLSPDGLLLMFADYPGGLRPSGYGGTDLWMARRATVSSPWQTPVNIGPIVNGQGYEWYPVISPDGSTLYFWSNRIGGQYIYQAPILPIVDFNADGIVDIQDLLLLIEHWGQSDSRYDIGPFAWGDGKVDIEDLKVFIAEWEKANAADSQEEPAQP